MGCIAALRANVCFPPIADNAQLDNLQGMFLLALTAAAQITDAASLSVPFADRSTAMVRVRADRKVGYRLTIDCTSGCAKPLHFQTPIADAPMGLVYLDADDLVYSVWGTGCCYVVRVWKIAPNGVRRLLETGSRGRPSILWRSGLTIETYVRPTDATGRETSMSLRSIRWIYRRGRFIRS